MISIDEDLMAEAFGGNVSETEISNLTTGYMSEISSAITTDISKSKTAFLDGLSKLTKNMLNDYVEKNGMMGMATIKPEEAQTVVNNALALDSAKAILAGLEKEYVVPQDTFSTVYNQLMLGFIQGIMMPVDSMGMGNISGAQMPSMPAENTLSNEITSIPENVTQNMPSTNGATSEKMAIITKDTIDTMVNMFVSQDAIISAAEQFAAPMTEAVMQKTILTKVGELTGKLMEKVAGAFSVDADKMASAFKFEMNEDEMRRLFQTMSSTTVENADTNLLSLGYQDIEAPTTISFYFKDFDSKEKFVEFIDKYNEEIEKEDEEKVINYVDITGLLMSSVKTIVDSVSYVLIAFVSISLVVSSIMIGIITYISVLERTKEIGVLRAIGASKRNISSIFNAETFIVGLFSGLIGIGTTLLLLIPTNMIIHSVNEDITALLPTTGAVILVVLSVILTLIGGIIPSRAAAKKDPVLALRTE